MALKGKYQKFRGIKHATPTYFNDKTVWITGASSGIGEELAIQIGNFAKQVLLTARNEEKLQAVAKKVTAETIVLPCDLTDEREVRSILAENKEMLKKVDVLILNAGISQRSLAKETQMSVYRKVMELNFFGAIQLSQYLLQSLAEKNGKIIVISSVAGKFGVPYRSAYCASKHALHGYFEALRLEEEVDVSIVCPGFIKTDISRNAVIGNGEKYGRMDDGQTNGMLVGIAVQRMLRKAAMGKKDIFVGGFKETRFAVFMHNNFPNLFYKILRKSKVR